MTTLHQDTQAEPFFITTEVEAELIAAGYQFEPPSHFATMRRKSPLIPTLDNDASAQAGKAQTGTGTLSRCSVPSAA